MNLEKIATEILACAIAHTPDSRLLGNIPASDFVTLCAFVLDTCPKCGSTAWVNIDCDLCTRCHKAKHAESSPLPGDPVKP